ncbi:protocatechuate 4,5-dioxygenase subunit alpha [Aurantiacibacter hainanensis]|uniref:protocatechuate 4,5-dioxygenase subunit alpha n=1 Tax=Aurantiacibacter hainanensis TaxID=3076114 RepID=UPI0030C6AEC8
MPRTRLYPLEDLEDIPGTKVFNARRSREAYHLHKFCMSLMKAENREEFKADERAYLDKFAMTEEQKQGVLERDLTRLIELGGNMYFLVKIASTDGWSALKAVSSMSGMSAEEYSKMMLEGGRSPKGMRSIRDKN